MECGRQMVDPCRRTGRRSGAGRHPVARSSARRRSSTADYGKISSENSSGLASAMRNTTLQRDLLRAGLTIGSGAGRIACNRIPSRTVLTGSGGPRGQFGETDRTMPKLQRGRINNSTVDALPVADKEVVFWDSELRGFGVRVYRSGGKVYVVQGRSGGKSKRYTIGRHGVITAEEARRKAAMTIAAIKGGQEPELSSSGWIVGPPRKKSGLSAIDGMPNSITGTSSRASSNATTAA